MGITIKEAQLVEQVTGKEKIPVSDGSGQPKAVTTEQIKDYIGANEGDDNVQSDWNETDPTSDAFIKNKPTIYSKPSTGIPKSDLDEGIQQSLEKADKAIQRIKTVNGESLLGEGDITIESGSNVTEETVAGWGFTKNTGDYSKPSSGIPKSDLASDVQSSLNKADTALQEHQDISNLATKSSVSQKQDKLISGTNIKTINGNSILGSGNIVIEGGGGGGGSSVEYASLLKTSLTADNIVVTSNELIVPFNFRAVKVSLLGNINLNSRGTLNIQRSTDNGATFNDVGTIPSALRSEDFENDDTYTDIDLGGFLSNGKQMIRVRASFEYEDERTGEVKTAVSTWVNIGETITKTELRLTLLNNYYTPMYAINEETGAYNNFVLNYQVYGAVAKRLVVQVRGAVAVNTITSDLSADVDGASKGISLPYDSAYDYHRHGVREITAWLEAEDGLGNTLKSEVLTNQIMMVNPNSDNYDATQKYLLLQNVHNNVTNYIQSTIADYAVYSPDGSDTELTFSLRDTKDSVYTEIIKVAKSNINNTLMATIEIEPEDEGSVPDGYRTRFYVFKGGENFIASSGLNQYGYYDIYVDNKEAIVPVLGSTFMLNPKNRDNSEADPAKIYNEKANNQEVRAEFENFDFLHDCWVLDENGEKVLRVRAGSRLVIHRNVWSQFMTTPDSAMTFDLAFKVRNVTNTSDPIISFSGGGKKGVVLNALKGWIRSNSYQEDDNCMFAWRENERQYLAVNVHNAVYPKGNECKFPENMAAQANGSMAYARILLNGDPVREIPFDKTSDAEWCTDPGASIIIGNDGADVDIYFIRDYRNTQIDLKDLFNRNYLSTLPTTEQKQKEKQRNALMEGGRITLERAQELGLNCIVYHGSRPYIHNLADQKDGWIEYFRYDKNKNLLAEFSGTNCKGSKKLGWKPQGSTAKTYYEDNVQDDNSKVTATIEVALEDFHESISVRVDGDKAYIMGGNLGKNYPLEMEEAEYPYADGKVTVPDGWIDGNGKYRGMGYQVAEGTSLAQKKVAKINYASAMQSHLLAACKSYDELHYLCVGASPLQQQYLDKGLTKPVLAKHTEPFLMFWDEGDGNVYYTGLCVYGAGKMDKVSWGYVKKKHPMFAMVEGADNNLPLTDFRVPFDDNVTYDTKEEGWVYNGEQSFDFDAGATDDNDVPKEAIRKQFARFHNFTYLNSTNLKVYDGEASAFRNSELAQRDFNYKYWCTEGTEAFHLLRYDFINKEWVNAGLKDADGKYAVVDLKTDIRTRDTYIKYKYSSAFEDINQAFISDYAKFFKDNGKFFLSLKSLLFNYCYVLSFLAGTDNSSKNTYFDIDPIAQNMSADANNAFTAWWQANFVESFNYAEVYQIFLAGDDMDSILPVNNKGNLTKPYYIERLYPYSDDNPDDCLYEGMNNQLFNLVEKAYTDEERSSMINSILSNAQSLVSDNDVLYGLESNKVSVWGFLHKFFFNVQYYFPQICYIEQARIRYEFAELMGHTGARGVRPISQSIGSQVENEQQFMAQRLVYMASFAVFGSLGNGAGSIGLSDATDQFAFQGSPLPNGNPASFVFHVKPHQYIYPCAFNGQTTRPSYQRTSPNQTCALLVAENVAQVSDTSMGIRGINYYSEMGELKDKSITTPVNIMGKRLKVLSVGESSEQVFRPSYIRITAPNVSLLTLHLPMDELDMTQLIRLKEIDLGGINKPMFPKSGVLTSVSLKGNVAAIVLDGQPNLVVLDVANKATIQKLVLDTPKIATQALAEGVYTAQQANVVLQNISISGVDWTNFQVDILEWYADRGATFSGLIRIYDANVNQPSVTWDLKNKFIKKFGDIDTGNGDLTLEYRKRNFEASTAKIKGMFFVDDYIVRDKGYNDVETFDFSVTPESQYMNNQTKIQFSLEGGNTSAYSMSADGKLSVNVYQLSDKQNFATIKAAVTQYENGSFVTENVTKKIDIWNRPAQVGDVVYYDGSYGSADEYVEGGKTAVGVCCYVAPRNADGSINATFHNPKDKMSRIMISLKDITLNSKTEFFEYLKFGLFCRNDFSEESNSIYYLTENGEKEFLSLDGGLTSLYDIPTVRNLHVGMTLSDGTPTEELVNWVMEDYSDAALKNGGFKLYSSDVAMGDGFAYNESLVLLNDRTINNSLKTVASELYSIGDIVNSGYAKTLNIILYRNRILNSGIEELGLKPGLEHFHIPKEDGGLYELAECMSSIKKWAKSEEGLNDSYGDKYTQFYYPAASSCYAYAPTVKSGENLSNKFKQRNWFLPTTGVLNRIIYYFYDLDKDPYKDRTNSPFSLAINKGILSKLKIKAYNSCTERDGVDICKSNLGHRRCGTYAKSDNDCVRPICAF